MRVMFTVSDWPSHYYPLVPIGWALQSAGHQVRVVCAPSQTATLNRSGLTPVPLLRPGLDMTVQSRLRNYWDAQKGTWPHRTLPPHPLTGAELSSLDAFDFAAYRAAERPRIMQATRDNFDTVVDFARTLRPDLVLHDRMSIEGLLAARVLGIPAALNLWGPLGTAEPDPALRFMPGDPTGSFTRHGAGEMSPDLVEYVIDPCPRSLEPPTRATRLAVRHLPYNGPGTDPALAPPAHGRPRVCVVWGNSLTSSYGTNSRLLPELAAAFTGLGAEILLLGAPDDTAALGPLPPDVRILGNAPLRLVLPGCTAVVHYGGAGCTMTALACGIPQLGIPFSPELAVNATRVAAAGAGLVVPASHPDRPAALRAALSTLLSTPSYHEHAQRLRTELDQRPTPAALVTELTALATRTASTTPHPQGQREVHPMPTPDTAVRESPDQLRAEVAIRELALGAGVAAALQTAVKLRVADAINDDTVDAATLGRAVNAAPHTLARLLRTLATHGVFEEDGHDRFRHTTASRLLRTDAPGGMADMVLWAGADWTWDAWPRLEEAVRNGKPVVPDLYGKDFFSYLKEDARHDAQIFNRAMTQASELTSRAVADTLPLDDARTVADIGGGHGHLLRTILETHPHLTGELFDLAPVVAGADPALRDGGPLADRTRITAGDCLDSVPLNADVYVIKQILKWDDERSVRVLRNVARHARPGARIVAVQNLVDLSPEPTVTTAMDLFLLLNVGGREHTKGDFEQLFERAGLEFTGVTQARSALYLIEARVPGTPS